MKWYRWLPISRGAPFENSKWYTCKSFIGGHRALNWTRGQAQEGHPDQEVESGQAPQVGEGQEGPEDPGRQAARHEEVQEPEDAEARDLRAERAEVEEEVIHVPKAIARRLDLLKSAGVIAGWQDSGGPNYGLSKRPLPALVFPAAGTGAKTFYDENELGLHVSVLEHFGPIA